jgi:hypothetical protein
MVGTTGTVGRKVEVQDVVHRGSQVIVDGTTEEDVTEACIVVAELPDKKLRVVVFGASGGVQDPRTIDASEFTPAVG